MKGQAKKRYSSYKLLVSLLLVMLSMFAATTALAETTVFSDIIDNSFYNNWTISGGNSSYKWVKGSTPGSSDYYAICFYNNIESTLTQTTAVNVSDIVTLKFDAKFTGVNLDNYIKADVFNGSSWVEVHSLEQRLGAFTAQEIDVSQYANANFKVRFRARCFPSAAAYIDNIAIIVRTGPSYPGAFNMITPSDGATGVSETPTFSWSMSDDATSYDLYYGKTMPASPTVTDLTTTSYTVPIALEAGAAYTWKVVAKNETGTKTVTDAPGSFTTAISTAIPTASSLKYNMNEGTGTALYEASGSGNNWPIVGAAWTNGQEGNGLLFDGIDDYVVMNYSKYSNNFTVAAWVKATTTHQIDEEGTTGYPGTSGQKYLFGANQEGTNAGVGVSVGTNGISVYEHGDSYMPALAVFNGTVGSDWAHIAVTYENGRPRIYLNGVLVRTGLQSPRGTSYSPTKLGSGPYGAFSGKVDNVAVYDRTLNANEVLALYNDLRQDSTEIFYYDYRGNVIKTETSVGGATYVAESVYDDLGRTSIRTFADGSKVYYSYNNSSSSVSKVGSTADGDEYMKSSTFDKYGQLTECVLGNNVKLTYTYDPENFRTTDVTAVNGSGQNVQELRYSYNAVGMITNITDIKNDTNFSYTYDSVYRLTNAKRDTGVTPGSGNVYSKSYGYNNINNITNFEGTSYTYGDSTHKHAVTTVKDTAGNVLKEFVYDANGNMTSGDGRTYVWNAENRPVSVTKDGVETLFDYDGAGNRIRKICGDKKTIYVGGCEIDQDGKKTAYISAGGVTVKKKDDGTLFFILKDQLGGMSTIIDSNGAVVTQQFYQPYGLDDSELSFANEQENHKFTGQEEDTETGLYNYNARLYDPALGRFISADPLDGPNRYAYCGNNPINSADPSGYKTTISVGGISLDRWSITGITNSKYTMTIDAPNGRTYTKTCEGSAADVVADMISTWKTIMKGPYTGDIGDDDVGDWFNDLDAWSQRNMSEACFAYQYHHDPLWKSMTNLSDAIIFDIFLMCSGGALGGAAEAGMAIPQGASWFVKLRMGLNSAFWSKTNLYLNGGLTTLAGAAGSLLNPETQGDYVQAAATGLLSGGSAVAIGSVAGGASKYLKATYDWWDPDSIEAKLATGLFFSGLKGARDALVNGVDPDKAMQNQYANLTVGCIGAIAVQSLGLGSKLTPEVFWNIYGATYCNAVAVYAYATGGSIYDIAIEPIASRMPPGTYKDNVYMAQWYWDLFGEFNEWCVEKNKGAAAKKRWFEN